MGGRLAFLWRSAHLGQAVDGADSGAWIAALAIGGMALSWIALFYSRGFSKLVSAGHVFTWTPLVLLLVFAHPEAAGAYGVYLTMLPVIDLISLAFDYNDARLWLRGDRSAVT